MGRRGPRQRNGHQGDGNQYRSHDEQLKPGGLVEVQKHLPDGHRPQVDDLIEGQDAPAVFLAGAFVDPAFHDHVEPAQAGPGDEAQSPPGDGIDPDNMHELRRRRDRAEYGERPDMTDPRDDAGGKEA